MSDKCTDECTDKCTDKEGILMVKIFKTFLNRILDTVNEIIPGVYLGDNKIAENILFYKKTGIKAVINCSPTSIFHDKNDINQLGLHIMECPTTKDEFYKCIPDCIEFIKKHNPILIHGFDDISVNCSLYAVYLMKEHNHTSQEAVGRILRQRPNAFNWGTEYYYVEILDPSSK